MDGIISEIENTEPIFYTNSSSTVNYTYNSFIGYSKLITELPKEIPEKFSDVNIGGIIFKIINDKLEIVYEDDLKVSEYTDNFINHIKKCFNDDYIIIKKEVIINLMKEKENVRPTD